jgi:S-methylmethionine-dependent homocysteine/selenocysteine methylase
LALVIRVLGYGVPFVLQSDASLREALQGRVLVLDGAMGTELERRGVPTPRPLWSAAALISHPEVVEAIHNAYVGTGADIIVANTFRTNVRTLSAKRIDKRGKKLNKTALDLARKAARAYMKHLRDLQKTADLARDTMWHRTAVRSLEWELRGRKLRRVLVAASVAPLEDCYIPDLVPVESVLDEEHAQMMSWLKAAGPDLIWIETMNTVREARAAARAARNAELPFVVSFVLREDGCLLGGERLEDAVAAVEAFEPIALGLNCIPPDGITAHLPRLRQATQLPLAAYAHINNRKPTPGWTFSQKARPRQYAGHVKRWLDLGATIVGGCCGTTVTHIYAVRNTVNRYLGG